MLEAEYEMIGLLRLEEAVDTVLDLQLVDSLRLKEATDAAAQIGTVGEPVAQADAWAQRATVIRVECLLVPTQPEVGRESRRRTVAQARVEPVVVPAWIDEQVSRARGCRGRTRICEQQVEARLVVVTVVCAGPIDVAAEANQQLVVPLPYPVTLQRRDRNVAGLVKRADTDARLVDEAAARSVQLRACNDRCTAQVRCKAVIET